MRPSPKQNVVSGANGLTSPERGKLASAGSHAFAAYLSKGTKHVPDSRESMAPTTRAKLDDFFSLRLVGQALVEKRKIRGAAGALSSH